MEVSSKTVSAASFVALTSAEYTAGNLGICIGSADNDGDATDTNDFTTLTDAAGNVWNVVGENEMTRGSASDGNVVAIYWSTGTTTLNSGSAMTQTYGAATNKLAKAIICTQFDVGGVNIIRVATSVGTEQKEDVTAGDTGSLTLGSLVNREHLWIRGIASETNNRGMTASAGGWVALTGTCTVGGAAAANSCSNVEFLISSGTTATSNSTMTVTADRASSMIALNIDTSSGPNNPGTMATDSSIGTVDWSNPDNAKTSDDAYASATLSNGTTSYYLKATNFSFNIPSTSRIDGIKAEAEKSFSGTTGPGKDAAVRIVKGGNIGTTDLSSADNWPGTDAYTVYGSSTQLWGQTWTASDINASGFGVALAAWESCSGACIPALGDNFFVDHMRVTVYFTVGVVQAAATRRVMVIQ